MPFCGFRDSPRSSLFEFEILFARASIARLIASNKVIASLGPTPCPPSHSLSSTTEVAPVTTWTRLTIRGFPVGENGNTATLVDSSVTWMLHGGSDAQALADLGSLDHLCGRSYIPVAMEECSRLPKAPEHRLCRRLGHSIPVLESRRLPQDRRLGRRRPDHVGEAACWWLEELLQLFASLSVTLRGLRLLPTRQASTNPYLRESLLPRGSPPCVLPAKVSETMRCTVWLSFSLTTEVEGTRRNDWVLMRCSSDSDSIRRTDTGTPRIPSMQTSCHGKSRLRSGPSTGRRWFENISRGFRSLRGTWSSTRGTGRTIWEMRGCWKTCNVHCKTLASSVSTRRRLWREDIEQTCRMMLCAAQCFHVSTPRGTLATKPTGIGFTSSRPSFIN